MNPTPIGDNESSEYKMKMNEEDFNITLKLSSSKIM